METLPICQVQRKENGGNEDRIPHLYNQQHGDKGALIVGNCALVVIPSCSYFEQRKNRVYFLGCVAQEVKKV